MYNFDPFLSEYHKIQLRVRDDEVDDEVAQIVAATLIAEAGKRGATPELINNTIRANYDLN